MFTSTGADGTVWSSGGRAAWVRTLVLMTRLREEGREEAQERKTGGQKKKNKKKTPGVTAGAVTTTSTLKLIQMNIVGT